jgi:hypothetical protein
VNLVVDQSMMMEAVTSFLTLLNCNFSCNCTLDGIDNNAYNTRRYRFESVVSTIQKIATDKFFDLASNFLEDP